MNDGIKVMLHRIFGQNADLDKYYGATITSAKIEDNALYLELEGGRALKLWDDGQSCCENRYMSTDDDVQTLVGAKLTRVEIKAGPSKEENFEIHEQAFLEVATDKGFITIVNHNEHNGYYGGFGLIVEEPKS